MLKKIIIVWLIIKPSEPQNPTFPICGVATVYPEIRNVRYQLGTYYSSNN